MTHFSNVSICEISLHMACSIYLSANSSGFSTLHVESEKLLIFFHEYFGLRIDLFRKSEYLQDNSFAIILERKQVNPLWTKFFFSLLFGTQLKIGSFHLPTHRRDAHMIFFDDPFFN